MKYLFFILCALCFGCTDSTGVNLNCLASESIGIQFTKPFDYKKTDTLSIDGVKFTHVSFLDSLDLGNYLPGKDAVIVEVRGKQATENTNEISMGRWLARQLNKSGNYKILNGAELLTSGKLRFTRVDGEKIEICTTQDYDATVFQ